MHARTRSHAAHLAGPDDGTRMRQAILPDVQGVFVGSGRWVDMRGALDGGAAGLCGNVLGQLLPKCVPWLLVRLVLRTQSGKDTLSSALSAWSNIHGGALYACVNFGQSLHLPYEEQGHLPCEKQEQGWHHLRLPESCNAHEGLAVRPGEHVVWHPPFNELPTSVRLLHWSPASSTISVLTLAAGVLLKTLEMHAHIPTQHWGTFLPVFRTGFVASTLQEHNKGNIPGLTHVHVCVCVSIVYTCPLVCACVCAPACACKFVLI